MGGQLTTALFLSSRDSAKAGGDVTDLFPVQPEKRSRLPIHFPGVVARDDLLCRRIAVRAAEVELRHADAAVHDRQVRRRTYSRAGIF